MIKFNWVKSCYAQTDEIYKRILDLMKRAQESEIRSLAIIKDNVEDTFYSRNNPLSSLDSYLNSLNFLGAINNLQTLKKSWVRIIMSFEEIGVLEDGNNFLDEIQTFGRFKNNADLLITNLENLNKILSIKKA